MWIRSVSSIFGFFQVAYDLDIKPNAKPTKMRPSPPSPVAQAVLFRAISQSPLAENSTVPSDSCILRLNFCFVASHQAQVIRSFPQQWAKDARQNPGNRSVAGSPQRGGPYRAWEREPAEEKHAPVQPAQAVQPPVQNGHGIVPVTQHNLASVLPAARSPGEEQWHSPMDEAPVARMVGSPDTVVGGPNGPAQMPARATQMGANAGALGPNASMASLASNQTRVGNARDGAFTSRVHRPDAVLSISVVHFAVSASIVGIPPKFTK